ncbi:MAG: hypothetical protein BWX86_02954 [Verrucomicrobia bacterium ADurb.Bin122]|nr:MAG: hypothetical protein BWX86_02954 [Verrucomicrobia bacterium ADurb.Bin122]
MPKAWARLATSPPMRPRPTIPRVLRKSSTPLNDLRSHLPEAMEAAAWGTGRAPQSMCVKVSSAVAMVLPEGVFITTTPRSVAASTSTLSTPTPARPTTLSKGAAAMTSRVILVSERTAMACTSFTNERIFSGEEPYASTTSKPGCWRRKATPFAEILSATRIFMGAKCAPAKRSVRDSARKSCASCFSGRKRRVWHQSGARWRRPSCALRTSESEWRPSHACLRSDPTCPWGPVAF